MYGSSCLVEMGGAEHMNIKDKRKIFIVGDVHGCFKEFIALLNKADYSSVTHRLILVGDIINRGPCSLEMLNWVRQHQVEVIRGNHEQAFIDGVCNKTDLSPTFQTLKWALKKDLNWWITWLSQLPFYIEEKDFLVVHGGLIPGEHPKYSNPYLLMNIRTWDGVGKDINNKSNPAWYSYYKNKKLVVYGHWASQGLNVRENTVGLDTGCVYGEKLSGILLPERKILQVPAVKIYYSS